MPPHPPGKPGAHRFPKLRDDEIDRVLGLELGGDDYVTKPFPPANCWRVCAVLWRGRGEPSVQEADASRPWAAPPGS